MLCKIDDLAEHFNTIFFEATCSCMPAKTVTIRSKDAAWINADILGYKTEA